MIKFQEFVSYAGDADRPDSHFLLTTPMVIYRFHRKWWIQVDTETRTDWEQHNRVSFRSGFGIGHMLSPRFGLMIKSEIPWGKHRSVGVGGPEGDWRLTVSLIWYRPGKK